MKKPEILSPAGNLERLEFAYAYGADAVYIGGRSFSLRAKAGNFSLDDMKTGVRIARSVGKKLYVTLNIYARGSDFEGLEHYVSDLADAGVDAVIVSDPGVFSTVQRVAPGLRIHISTQANVTNVAAADFWYRQGASRVVLARELPATEIREISQTSEIETEAFVHGAMCIAYSGRCLMSKFLADRDGNQGDCAHSCRWRYHLVEEKRPGEYHEISEDDRGTYIFNSKDLTLIHNIPLLMSCGLHSLKIEGRMKSTHYVAAITKIYRQAVDRYFADPHNYEADPEWFAEIEKVSHRQYSTGFFLGGGGEEILDCTRYDKSHDFVAVVDGYDEVEGFVILNVRNRLRLTDPVDILSPAGLVKEYSLPEMYRLRDSGPKGDDSHRRNQGNGARREQIEVAHAGFKIGVPSEKPWPAYSILRRPVD